MDVTEETAIDPTHQPYNGRSVFMTPVERYDAKKFPGLEDLLRGLDERARTFNHDNENGDSELRTLEPK